MAFANYLRLDSLELGALLCVHLSAHCINENLPKERRRLYTSSTPFVVARAYNSLYCFSNLPLMFATLHLLCATDEKKRKKEKAFMFFPLSLSNMEINQPERLAHFLSTTILLFFSSTKLIIEKII
jgi:hypothetical protein